MTGPPWIFEKSSWAHSEIFPAGVFPIQTDETIVPTCQTRHLQSNLVFLDFDRFKSFRKMFRVFCYLLRFLKLIKTKQRAHSTPNVAEIHSASIKLLQLIQSCELHDEIALLHSQDNSPKCNF